MTVQLGLLNVVTAMRNHRDCIRVISFALNTSLLLSFLVARCGLLPVCVWVFAGLTGDARICGLFSFPGAGVGGDA